MSALSINLLQFSRIHHIDTYIIKQNITCLSSHNIYQINYRLCPAFYISLNTFLTAAMLSNHLKQNSKIHNTNNFNHFFTLNSLSNTQHICSLGKVLDSTFSNNYLFCNHTLFNIITFCLYMHKLVCMYLYTVYKPVKM